MLTRHVIAVAQMLVSAILIHLTGGRLETHFHIFGSLAILAIYRDWRVLITASAVVAADHLLRGIYWPQSAYGVLSVTPWRWMEHTGWVVFEDLFLIAACVQGSREIWEIAARRRVGGHQRHDRTDGDRTHGGAAGERSGTAAGAMQRPSPPIGPRANSWPI